MSKWLLYYRYLDHFKTNTYNSCWYNLLTICFTSMLGFMSVCMLCFMLSLYLLVCVMFHAGVMSMHAHVLFHAGACHVDTCSHFVPCWCYVDACSRYVPCRGGQCRRSCQYNQYWLADRWTNIFLPVLHFNLWPSVSTFRNPPPPLPSSSPALCYL